MADRYRDKRKASNADAEVPSISASEKRSKSTTQTVGALPRLPLALLSHELLPFLSLEELMDYRALCRSLQPVCEVLAVRWMNSQLQDVRHSVDEVHAALIRSITDYQRADPEDENAAAFAAALPELAEVQTPFLFTLQEARWTRAQLSRWQRRDSTGQLVQRRIPRLEAVSVYGEGFVSGSGPVRCIDILKRMLRTYLTADGVQQALDRVTEANLHYMADTFPDEFRAFHAEKEAREAAELKWQCSSTGQPLLFTLDDAIIGFVLSFIDFEQLMLMRAVSKRMQELSGNAAVAFMDRRFPRLKPALRADEKTSGRVGRSDSVATVSSLASLSLSSSRPAAASSHCSRFSEADAVWLQQSISWCRLLDCNAAWFTRPRLSFQRELRVSRREAVNKFGLSSQQVLRLQAVPWMHDIILLQDVLALVLRNRH